MNTVFKAYQLPSHGSLFSFFKNGISTLIEARLPQGGIETLKTDFQTFGQGQLDLLHITSWDTDHCSSSDLLQILHHLKPAHIQVPSYIPDSEDGKYCYKIIHGLDGVHRPLISHTLSVITQDYIRNLSIAEPNSSIDVIYESQYNCGNKNDMSLIRLFRSQGFNVLSLGDCESQELADRLLQCSLIRTEVDVLILPHHGADNGFLTGKLLDGIKPKVAVCSSNFANMYGHPTQTIRNLLSSKGIPLYTTKTSDIVIFHNPTQNNSAGVFTRPNVTTKYNMDQMFLPKRFNR